MVSEDRQRVIETNRSLRIIRNELETLLEKGIITDDAFDQVSSLLPAEGSVNRGTGASSSTTGSRAPVPTPSPRQHDVAATPPSYSAASAAAAPPSLPHRSTPAPVRVPASAPPAPARAVIAHARALYRYGAADARDCGLEKGDAVEVFEYMNADWWLGRNARTDQTGIFPKTYVELEAPPLHEQGGGGSGEKAGYNTLGVHDVAAPPYPPPGQQVGGYAAGGGGGYPAPPPQGMQGMPQFAQDANGQGSGQVQGQPHAEGEGAAGGKAGEYGKKFGKKLGNAAIFGAGATIGSNIVNSIF